MTLYLIRHASASQRKAGDPFDLGRNLDEKGWEQARGIRTRLANAGITALYSSAAVRCVQTLQPLSESIDLPIEVHPALLEGQSALPAVSLLQQLATSQVTAGLCSHGDIIPDSIQTLARQGMVIQGVRGWAKGSTWRLETRGLDITHAVFDGPF